MLKCFFRQVALYWNGDVDSQPSGCSVSPMMTFGPIEQYRPISLRRATIPLLK